MLSFVKKLHGFGDFAASNVAMLLGFYDLVPMDSETVRFVFLLLHVCRACVCFYSNYIFDNSGLLSGCCNSRCF